MNTIISFTGKNNFLSNFYPAPITYCGLSGPTLEHVYQASKTTVKAQASHILRCETAALAKAAGARVVDLRPDWNSKRVEIMYGLLQLKFAIPTLREKLLATGDAHLVEGNTWNDTFWGVCDGEGLNMLGLLLMQVRYEIRQL